MTVKRVYHVELAGSAPPPVQQPVMTVASQPGVAEATSTNGNGSAPEPISLTQNERAQRALAAATGVKAPPKNLRTNQPVEGGGRAVVTAQKVGRNDPCPCGSGKKYKKCHGATAA